jgi:hypothetical protein
VDERTVEAALFESHLAIDRSMQRKVAAHVYIFTCVEARAALANEDIARLGRLSTEKLDTESLTLTIPAVIGTTYAFFVCHDTKIFVMR